MDHEEAGRYWDGNADAWIELARAGFRLEYVAEPCPTDEVVRRCSAVQEAQVVAYFLHVRVREPR
jgi:hypothetical protein